MDKIMLLEVSPSLILLYSPTAPPSYFN